MPLKYAEDVAPEIWQNCLMLAERDDLPALSLACRLFDDICKPMIFERMTFCLPDVQSRRFFRCISKIDSVKKRYQEVSNSGRFNQLVRCLTFGSYYIPPRPVVNLPSNLSQDEQLQSATAAYEELLGIISSSVSQFSRLQAIDMGAMPLGAELMQNLGLLQHLNKIHLDTTSGMIFPNGTPPLRVNEFSYFEYTRTRSLSITNPPVLVASEHLQDMSLFGLQACDIIYSFIRHGTDFKKLRSLTFPMKPSDIPLFFDFLLICPALEKLRITSYQDLAHVVNINLPALPTSAAPRLTDYLGPDAIAVALASGRPMSTTVLVNITSGVHGLITSSFETFGRSTPPMRSLNLGMRFMSRMNFGDLARYLPQLQKFTVHIEERSNMEATPNDAISYVDILRELRLGILLLPQSLQILGLCPQQSFGSGKEAKLYPIEEQRHILTSLSSRYVELHEVSLGMPTRVDWRKGQSSTGEANTWVQVNLPEMFPPLF